MIIKVANPGECPLRHSDDNIHWCSAKTPARMPCSISPMIFPDKCPLKSRTIVIEKAEEEQTQDTGFKMPDEEERKRMCERHGVQTGI